MRLILRIILLLATLRFAVQALIGYAFDFRSHGYPVWPLFIVGFSFWGYVKLRPPEKAPPAAGYSSQTRDSILFLLLALMTSAFLLERRGEHYLTPVWLLHLSTLTFFQLLVPFLIAYACDRARPLVTALATLVLMVVMVDGTFKDSELLIQYLQEAQAYSPGMVLPPDYVAPMEILPPAPEPAPDGLSSDVGAAR